MYQPDKPYVARIKQLIRSTWDTPYLQVEDLSYPVFMRRVDGWEVDHTDGIGTKGLLHWEARTWESAVIDALAMNLNDIATLRAVPYKLQNHLILPEDNHDFIERIVTHLATKCKERKIAITGGETSIHNNIKGMDLSITISAFIKEPMIQRFEIGDSIVGLASSGLHSNGITMARKYLEDMKSVMVTPTIIYYDQVMSIAEKFPVKGLLHIAGGGYTRLKSVLGKADAILKFSGKPIPAVYGVLHTRGVPVDLMYTYWNCGYGFLISCEKKIADAIVAKYPNTAVELGLLEPGNGTIYIDSSFNQDVTL